jgi:ribosome-binding protein aMBF1 (putative translation factor)
MPKNHRIEVLCSVDKLERIRNNAHAKGFSENDLQAKLSLSDKLLHTGGLESTTYPSLQVMLQIK